MSEDQAICRPPIIRGIAADLAVLSQDILTAPLEALPATASLLTIVDGATVCADGPFAALGASVHLKGSPLRRWW